MVQIAPGSAIPLADAGIDRAGHRRRDQAWLDTAFTSANVQLLLMKDGLPLVEGGAPPRPTTGPGLIQPGARPVLWLGPQGGQLSTRAQRLFLGETERGAPVFALDLPSSFSLASSPIAGLGVFEDFRAAAAGMSAFDASAAATARALFEWRRRHGFCANCGAETDLVEAGWKAHCPSCKAEHFPRVDPVAIMLAVRGNRCLLGRQKAWPPGFWSCLAGFIEPGETIEQAAARELFEEAGVRTSGPARYLFSQPWPFVSSLMLGLILEADSEEVVVDTDELEDARWFDRTEVAAMMSRSHPTLFAPPPLAIAHHVIRAWLDIHR
jgi:NAD+ diphosphatase